MMKRYTNATEILQDLRAPTSSLNVSASVCLATPHRQTRTVHQAGKNCMEPSVFENEAELCGNYRLAEHLCNYVMQHTATTNLRVLQDLLSEVRQVLPEHPLLASVTAMLSRTTKVFNAAQDEGLAAWHAEDHVKALRFYERADAINSGNSKVSMGLVGLRAQVNFEENGEEIIAKSLQEHKRLRFTEDF